MKNKTKFWNFWHINNNNINQHQPQKHDKHQNVGKIKMRKKSEQISGKIYIKRLYH